MGLNLHDLLRKVVVYTRKHKNLKNKIIVMIWNYYHFKNETLNLQGIRTLSKIHIYSKMMKNKNLVYSNNYNNLL
jgi:hypothetical protein